MRDGGLGCIGRSARQLDGLVDGLRKVQRVLLGSLGRLPGLAARADKAGKERAGFIERSVGAQGDLLHTRKCRLELWAFTRRQLDAGFEVAELVGGFGHALGKAPGIAAAQRHGGDLLDALQLGADGRHALAQRALVLDLHLGGLIGRGGGLLVGRGHGRHLLPHLGDSGLEGCL